MIEKFSSQDHLTIKERSSKNCNILWYEIMISKNVDWEYKLIYLVKEEYLIQSDADMLLKYWKRELEIIQENEEKAIFFASSPKTIKGKLRWLVIWIEEVPKNKIAKAYLEKLLLGSLIFVMVFGLSEGRFYFKSEYFRMVIALAVTIWVITAMDIKKEDHDDAFRAGVAWFLIFFIGYWALVLLANIVYG